MARTQYIGDIGGHKVRVPRLTRREISQAALVKNAIADALPSNHTVTVGTLDDFVALCMCKPAGRFENVEGDLYEIPSVNDPIDDLVDALNNFLDSDPSTGANIIQVYKHLNGPTAPKHILPEDMLTDEEKNDPESEGSGDKTSNA